MTTPEDLLNSALRRVGYPTPIGSIFEGSRASRAALDFYVQTRDSFFRSHDWDLLRQQVSLGNPIKTAPPGGYPPGTPWDGSLYPPPDWVYAYAFPANCIEVRAVMTLPAVLPNFTPHYVRFVVADDPVSQEKVVLTNAPNALAVITGRVTNPDTWQDAAFTEALIDALAEQFQKYLGTGDVNKIAQTERDTQLTIETAQMRRA